MKIGFIGLGIMGKPMSKNLLKAGHELLVLDRNQASVEEVVAAGAKIGERPENYLDGDWGIAVVGHQRTIAAGSVIKPKEIV